MTDVDRTFELESQIRSLAMMRPDSLVLKREEAMSVLTELKDVTDRFNKLKVELRQLAEQA
jgi:hypothetical protein